MTNRGNCSLTLKARWRQSASRCPGGGIGRRAGFRYLWPKGRGSSSLLGTIIRETGGRRLRSIAGFPGTRNALIRLDEHPSHRGDLARRSSTLGPIVAVDTETMGLNPLRDRLCLVQLSARRRQLRAGADRRRRQHKAPNLQRLLEDPDSAQDLPFRPLRCRRPEAGAGHRLPAALLHQDRLAAGAHLHRPPWAQGPGTDLLGDRALQAAAILRLGRARS